MHRCRSGPGPPIQPDIGLAIAGLVPLVQQFAIGAVVKDGGQPVLVELFDPLAERIVGIGRDLGSGLAGDEAVVAVGK